MDRRQRFLTTLESLSPTQTKAVAQKLFEELIRTSERQTEVREDDIAVVGMACRLPAGITSPAQFWQLLQNGKSGIESLAAKGWREDSYSNDPDEKGKLGVKRGGVMKGFEFFDHALFGISKLEAQTMDPHQKHLLEVAWEAFEHAGLQPRALRGSDTGVFVGIMSNDMTHVLIDRVPLENADPFTVTGAALSASAGRIAYVFGLQGPALAIDTACSSSLVAIHQASQALRLGECDVALAGGITLFLTPTYHIWLSNAQMLSRDGECKAFDSSANGYVRSEGCGLFVLKRLSKAIADNDRVHAILRGSAVNQTGRAQGFTAPNGPSQETVIRRALQSAKVSPADVGYVEAHGTGTSLGDPIEIGALRNAYCTAREADRPLYVGSVKSNIGHCEAGAGSAGLLKVILSLQHGKIPPSLNVARLNPHLDLSDDAALKVVTSLIDWPSGGRRLAGVSSFGFTGSNAHVVVEAFEGSRLPTDADLSDLHVVKVSAESPTACLRLAKKYADYFGGLNSSEVADACYTLNRKRGNYRFGRVIHAATPAELAQQLATFASGQPAAVNERRRAKLWLELRSADVTDAFFREARSRSRLLEKIYADCREAVQSEFAGRTSIFAVDASASDDDKTILQFTQLVAYGTYLRDLGVRLDYIVDKGAPPFACAVIAAKLGIADGTKLLSATLGKRSDSSNDLAAVCSKVDWKKSSTLLYIDNPDAGVYYLDLLRQACAQARKPPEKDDLIVTLSTSGLSCAFENRSIQASIGVLLDAYYRCVGAPLWERLYPSGNWCEAPLYAFDPLRSDELFTAVNEAPRAAVSEKQMSDALEEQWVEAKSSAEQSKPGGSLLVICDAEDASSLRAEQGFFVLTQGDKNEQAAINLFKGSLASAEELRSALTFVRARVSFDGVVYLPSARAAAEALLRQAAALIGELVNAGAELGRTKLYLLTRGANSVRNGERVNAAHAAMRSLVKCFALEHPQQFGGSRDLPIGSPYDLNKEIEICTSSPAQEIASRDQRAFKLRIRYAPKQAEAALDCSASGAYLLVGGTGGLGLCAAEALAEAGARKLILTGRSGRIVRAECADRAARLRHQGIDVRVHALDLNDEAALRDLLARIRVEGPLLGVVHAAGVSHHAPLSQLNEAELSFAIASKVHGADLLARLTRADALEFLVFFSSIAGVWGAAGMAAYSAANRYLDALAINERANGRRAYSIAWGPWAELGMAAQSLDAAAASGLLSLQPERGKQLIKAILSGPPRQAIAARLDLPRFVDLYASKADAQLFEGLATAAGPAQVAPLRDELDSIPGSERLFVVDEVIARLVRAAINFDHDVLSVNEPLHHLGIESLQAVAIRNELTKLSGVKLPHALLFNYPTIRDISALICQRMYDAAA